MLAQTSRRQLLADAAMLGAGALTLRLAAAQAGRPRTSTDLGLAALAARKGLFFGVAAHARHLDQNPEFAALVGRECACLVPEWDMKWRALQPTLDTYAPQAMDRLVAHASSHGLWLRGHTLFWHQSLPDWFDTSMRATTDWERIVVPYARYVAQRYGVHLRHWDVVNEGLNPQEGRSDPLRAWRLTELFGQEFFRRAFELARALTPNVTLFYNDYGLEYEGTWHEARRTVVLRHLERWRRAGIPVDALGIQGHLTAGRHDFAQTRMRAFLSDVAALDLEIVVTELDVSETHFDSPIPMRDQAVADEVERFLDVVLDEPAVTGILTWGLTDRYSWLEQIHDSRNRGLPYDRDLAKKPMWHAIARALGGARMRPERKSR